MPVIGNALPMLLLAATAACSGGGETDLNAVPANETAAQAPEDAAVLAQDPELANDAAADEAADMEAFGGNAAAMGQNRQ
jgi:hypothetical protein